MLIYYEEGFGIATWDLSYDIGNFWDRFLDGMTNERNTLPRDLMRRTFKESRNYCVDYTKLLASNVALYTY